MTRLAIFGLQLVSPPNLEGWLTRGLAVVGAAAVGAVGVGILTQVLVKVLTTRTAPRSVLRLMRVGGAVTAGWLVFWLLFGASGRGPGPGGPGTGEGKDGPAGDANTDPAPPDRDKAKEKEGGLESPDVTIEVVGETIDPQRRFYRFKGQPKRHTLGEIREELRERRKQEPPPKKVLILLYQEGSPAPDQPNVTDLEDELKKLGLAVLTQKKAGKAPR